MKNDLLTERTLNGGHSAPDGSPVKNLDRFNGHKDKNGNYHYHATKKYPYLNGGFYGEVTVQCCPVREG